MITASLQRIEEFTRQGWWWTTILREVWFRRADGAGKVLRYKLEKKVKDHG